ncbi:MAG: PilZ domain-containing protein [Alphaproteobacteria bacterium]|nr:PilZ domain-containing protein [Alphaproteobacteria bacterium]MBU1526465.1 PilZ domain-containing protein [Alphaproteobacteria bacterium]MBU2116083.1 PilZ domain-containing protein [Alphaproteobacteria bacterium]MBU2350995.1 PilZ domain-containing protein [Alphaproteobacteria bacterium]MBU2382529.1 PilZ domain-containing protein [Alphaproteobacteria bacterium]
MSSERRSEVRLPADGRGLLVGPGVEQACRLVDQSASGLRVRLDRSAALPREVMIVDVPAGVATPVTVVWQKGQEAGLKRCGDGATLRGLVPGRLVAVRDAWRRAGGR